MSDGYCDCGKPADIVSSKCAECAVKTSRNKQAEPCCFCRVGSCGIHHVHRLVSPDGHNPLSADDESMAEVGCCEEMESAVRCGVIKRDGWRLYLVSLGRRSQRWTVRRCPFCMASDS